MVFGDFTGQGNEQNVAWRTNWGYYKYNCINEKERNVFTEVICKICKALNCLITNIMEFIE